MNKTVTINISGVIFHIEEDAYDSLSRYLGTIKGYFNGTDGGSEIMSDIEARIAELLQARINVSKQVILMADVDHVMGVMGRPEEFGAETKSTKEESEPVYQERIKRRLFRNPEDKAIGGVCSGLAAYFDIDTVWVRLAMFLLIFFGGISLWVYIVLWIVMPEARTTADKMAMRGEPANINNIMRSVREEADDVKNRFSKEANDVKDSFKKYGRQFRDDNYGERVRSGFANALAAIFNVAGRLIGLFLIIIGGILLFAYVASLMGISIADGNADITHWRSVIFGSSGDYVLGVIAFIIVAGIPVLMLVYGGVKLLFHIRYRNRWLNLSLGILWLFGLLLGTYVTVKTVKQFNENARLRETFQIHGTGDTIIVKMTPGLEQVKELSFDNDDDIDTYMNRNHGGYYFGEHDKKLSVIGYAGLSVVESNSDSVELIISRTSRGSDKRNANENAKAISYGYHQNGRELIFDEIFTVSQGIKFRAPEVDIRLKIPRGKVVYFDNSLKYMLDDIQNTSNTYDRDMVRRRWVMTGKGLQCIDCNDLDNMDEEGDWDHHHNTWKHKRKKANVTIDDDGVKVNDKDADIHIDRHGVRIETREPDDDTENDRINKKDHKKKVEEKY
jgi:phage shock protein PspC (stress-responsive transcriptional regulator)